MILFVCITHRCTSAQRNAQHALNIVEVLFSAAINYVLTLYRA